MSDTPREEEIYQALAPGGSYKSGLVNPVAAQREDTVSIPMRFKGAMGGQAVGNEDYPDHEPRASVPYKHYRDLEDIDPKLHQAVTHVADEIHVPRTDLASLVYANSGYDPNTRKGMRTGYMGLTPDDARALDPEGNLDINDPIDNLFLGAMKYKRISNRFGMGTPNSFAAYYGGGDQINTVLNNDPDEHRRIAPDGTFDFLNKVLGRGEGSGGGAPPMDDMGGGGDDREGGVASMAAAAQAGAQPQRHVPGQGAVPPMMPNQDVPEAQLPPPGPLGTARGPAGPSVATRDTLAASANEGQFAPEAQYPPPSPPSAAPAASHPSLPSSVSMYRSYEGPPEAPRPAGREDTYEGPPEGALAPRRLSPYYPQEIRSAHPGAGRGPDASQATQEILAARDAAGQPPPWFARARPAPSEPNYNLNVNPPPDLEAQRAQAYTGPLPQPVEPPIDDTNWQRQDLEEAQYARAYPMPPDDTGWRRPMPPPPIPVLSGQGGALAPAPVQPPVPEDTRPTETPAPPDTSGGYAVGGAIGNAVADVVPDSYTGRPPVPPDQAPPVTTGSGAPPPTAAPAAAPTPKPQQAIGADNSAAELNRQELARIQGGQPPTTGSGAAPTTAPAAGYAAAPPADLPAGAPKALAPPGSEPTATRAPPIDRLKGNGGAMTPTSAVRAGAQGPDGVLTHIARNGPRGMSIGDGWDHFQDLLERAMIMKGDINGLQHAQEYVFRMKHKGAMENLMQAIGSMDDPETAVRFLAKSHAFVTDGTAIGFQVLNGQIYGQKYDEQTHDKIGKPFQVTEQGLRQLAISHSDPSKFNAALNTERTTNETGRHNRFTEKHQTEQLAQQEKQSLRNLEEKKLEFGINQKRYEDAAKQRAHEAELQRQQRQDIADQQERVRKETQEAAHRQQTAEKEKERVSREDQKEKDRLLREEQAAQRAADNAEKAAARAAEEKSGHAKYANEATDEYFGRGGMAGVATDHNNQPYKGPDLTRARTIFSGIMHHDKAVSSPENALDYTRGFLSGKYKMAESVSDDGKRFAHIRDEDGNVLATVPSTIWRMYLPKQGTVSTGAGKR